MKSVMLFDAIDILDRVTIDITGKETGEARLPLAAHC